MTDDFTIPDLAEPITGHRFWVLDDDGMLASPSRGGDGWPTDRALAATCRRIVPADGGTHRNRIRALAGFITGREEPCGECPSPIDPPRYRVRPATAAAFSQHLFGASPPRDVLSVDVEEVYPHNGHGCGIYAYTSTANLLGRERGFQLHLCIAGTVALSGRVYEYSHGYRAEKATVTGIYRLPGQSRGHVRAVAERYGVPLLRLAWRDRVAAHRALAEEAKTHAACCSSEFPRRYRIAATLRPWAPLAGAAAAFALAAELLGVEQAALIVAGAAFWNLLPRRRDGRPLLTGRIARQTTNGKAS